MNNQDQIHKAREVSEQIEVLCKIQQVGFFGGVIAGDYCSVSAIQNPESKTLNDGIADIAVGLTSLITSYRVANKNAGMTDAENDELINMIVESAKVKEKEESWIKRSDLE